MNESATSAWKAAWLAAGCPRPCLGSLAIWFPAVVSSRTLQRPACRTSCSTSWQLPAALIRWVSGKPPRCWPPLPCPRGGCRPCPTPGGNRPLPGCPCLWLLLLLLGWPAAGLPLVCCWPAAVAAALAGLGRFSCRGIREAQPGASGLHYPWQQPSTARSTAHGSTHTQHSAQPPPATWGGASRSLRLGGWGCSPLAAWPAASRMLSLCRRFSGRAVRWACRGGRQKGVRWQQAC